MRSPSPRGLPAVCLLAAVAFPALAFSQEADDQPPVPVTSTPSVEEVWERLIYLPYKNLRDVFQQQGATAFLPYAEYLELWERAGKQPDKRDAPPVDGVITQAHYTARIEKNVARIDARFNVHVLGKPWADVPVQFGEAAVGRITSDAGEVLLRGTGPGRYSLLFREKGEYEVTLELTTRVHTSPDGKSFSFQTPTVGITSLELVIPEADQAVDITPQLVSMPVDADSGETRVKANLGSTPQIQVAWHPETGAKPQMDVLASVTNQLAVAIRDGLIHTDATLQYEILRGEVSELRIVVPPGHRILGVSSPDAKLRGWQTQEEEHRQIVTVELLGAVSNQVTLEVHTEQSIPDGPFSAAGIDSAGNVHGIHALDAVRESGQLVLSHASDLTLNVEEQRGLTRTELSEVAERLRRSDALAFKFYSPNFTLRVSVAPVAPRLLVNHRAQITLHEDELRLRADLQYTVERAGVFELKLRLPENLTVEQVTGIDLKEFNVDEQARTLTATLNSRQQGSLQLTVTARRAFEDDVSERELTVPLLEPLDVERENGFVAVYVPEAIEIVADEENLVGVQPEPVRQAKPLRNLRPAAAWTFHRRPVTIPLRTIRRPTRLTANVGTTVNVNQTSVEIRTRLNYHIQYAGIDAFRFAVPETVADQVQIRSLADASGPGIKQRSREPGPDEGWVTWTVVMQRDVLGEQPFEVTYDLQPADAADLPPEEGGEPTERQIAIQPVRVLESRVDGDPNRPIPLSQISGEIAVVKDRALAVTATDAADLLEAIDVRELQTLPPSGVLAYRYFTQPAELTLTTTRHDVEEVVETVVSRTLIEVVIGRDETATYRCRYRLRSSERQRLGLELPAAAQLLGLFVDGRQINAETHTEANVPDGWQRLSVNVTRAKRADEPFGITLQFQVRLDDPFEYQSGIIAMPLPRIAGETPESVAVQQLRTVVWLPDEYAVIDSPDEFVRERSASWISALLGRPHRRADVAALHDWIGDDTSGFFDFPTEGRAYAYRNLGGATTLRLTWWRTLFHTVVLSTALLILALVLRRTTWENKLGILLLGAFATALYAMENPEGVRQGLAAARWGLLALAAIWLLHALFGRRGIRRSYDEPAEPIFEAQPMVPAVIPPPGVFEMIQPGRDKPPV